MKRTDFLAAILITAPVFGFLPFRSLRSEIEKDPNPTKEIRSPDFNAPVETSTNASSALFASAHHDRLFKAWEVLRSQIHAFLVYTWSQDEKVNKEFLPQWGPDHSELLEIIRTKQSSKAKTLIHEHVERGAKRVAKHFKESPSENVPKKKR